LCLRAADRDEDAQRAGDRERGGRAANVDMAVQLDLGMQGERTRLRQTQSLPRQVGERVGEVESKLQSAVQPFRLGDGLTQRRRDRSREKGVGEPRSRFLQRAFEPGVTRAAVTDISRRSPMAPRPLQPPI
jgi:hypothetical protein